MDIVGDVERRLQALEDARAVEETLYRYAEGLDYGPESLFLDVFDEDAVWQRADGRFGPRSFRGHRELVEMFRHHTHAPDYFHKHVVANVQVTVESDHATARSYLLFVADDTDGPYLRAFSRCHDRLIRCPDGRWRVVERRADLESRAERSFPPPPWADLPAQGASGEPA